MHQPPHLSAALVAALVGVTMLAATCGSETDATSLVAATADTISPVTAFPANTPAILDWEATLIGGGTIYGADLTGQDTLFWFWAPA